MYMNPNYISVINGWAYEIPLHRVDIDVATKSLRPPKAPFWGTVRAGLEHQGPLVKFQQVEV